MSRRKFVKFSSLPRRPQEVNLNASACQLIGSCNLYKSSGICPTMLQVKTQMSAPTVAAQHSEEPVNAGKFRHGLNESCLALK